MAHSECGSLFDASKVLLTRSGLVRWQGNSYAPTHPGNVDSGFEDYARNKFDDEYGRYICWLLFSVGSENLAKAACVCNGIVKTKPTKLGYPRYEVSMSPVDWVNKVLNDTKDENDTPVWKYDYHTLERYWKSGKKDQAYLFKLCEKHPVSSEDRDLLIASYKYLTKTIRNRDAHTYVANTRREDFPGVEPIFVPAFNTLVETMKKTGHPI